MTRKQLEELGLTKEQADKGESLRSVFMFLDFKRNPQKS